MEWNRTHQLQVCATDVNVRNGNTNSIERNRESLSDVSSDVRLEVNTENPKCLCLEKIII